MIRDNKLSSKIRDFAYNLSNTEISGNKRNEALKEKEKFDLKHQGKTKKMIQIKPGTWKEIYE